MNTKTQETLTVTFIPSAPKTQFESGYVHVVAIDRESILDIAGRSHLNLDPEKTVAALLKNRLEYTTEKPHFRVEAALDEKFMEPYFKALESLSGQESTKARTAEIPVPCKRNAITHYALECLIQHGHFVYDFAVQDYKLPLRGHTNQTIPPESERFAYAQKTALRCAENMIAHRPSVPEYIQNGNNSYSKNPKWGTGYTPPAVPSLQCRAVWESLLAWWLENEATPQQQAAVKAIRESDKAHRIADNGFGLSYAGDCSWYFSGSFYLPDPKGTCNYDGKGTMVRCIRSLSPDALKGWTAPAAA